MLDAAVHSKQAGQVYLVNGGQIDKLDRSAALLLAVAVLSFAGVSNMLETAVCGPGRRNRRTDRQYPESVWQEKRYKERKENRETAQKSSLVAHWIQHRPVNAVVCVFLSLSVLV